MLITFKSHASGDVVMLEENGKQMLSLTGKDPEQAQGIFTVEQLPAAVEALKCPIDKAKSKRRKQAYDDEGDAEHNPGEIQLFQRALPLLELVERSLQDKVPVTWGV